MVLTRAGACRPSGFVDVHATAWPMLREAELPFALYETAAYLDGIMHWPGSTSRHPGPAANAGASQRTG